MATSTLPSGCWMNVAETRLLSRSSAASRWFSRSAVLCPAACAVTICLLSAPMVASVVLSVCTPAAIASCADCLASPIAPLTALICCASALAPVTTALCCVGTLGSVASAENALCRLPSRLPISAPLPVAPTAASIFCNAVCWVCSDATVPFCVKTPACSALSMLRVTTPSRAPRPVPSEVTLCWLTSSTA